MGQDNRGNATQNAMDYIFRLEQKVRQLERDATRINIKWSLVFSMGILIGAAVTWIVTR